jgi:hypothetical protein
LLRQAASAAPRRPRPQDHLRRVMESNARGEDAVRNEAQRLIQAFNINVLL